MLLESVRYKEKKIKLKHINKIKEKKIKIRKPKKKQESNNLFDNRSSLISLIIPDTLDEKQDYVYLGDNRYVRSFILTAFPNKIYLGWLDRIFNKLGDINISIISECANESTVIKQLTHQVVKLQSEKLTYEKQGNISYIPALEETLNDYEEMRRSIQTTNDKLFFVTILLKINAQNLKELDTKSKILKDEFAQISATLRTISFRQQEGLKATLPINNCSIKNYERNFTSGGFSAMFPIANSDVSSKGGIYLGYNTYTGIPVYLDLFDKDLQSPHMVVLGSTGSGKSVTLKIVEGRSKIIGRKSAIIDVEGEYVKQGELLGSRIITIKQGVPSGINLFDIDVFEDDTKVNILGKVAEIRALLSGIMREYMNRPLTAKEMIDVENAVIETYKERGIIKEIESIFEKTGGNVNGKITLEKIKKEMPRLSDFHRILKTKENSKEVATILTGFLSGKSLGIFDCNSNINIKDQGIIFDMSQITDEVTKFYAGLVVTTWITNKYMLKIESIKKTVLIDEVWTLMKHEETADFLEILARTARKRGVSMILSTQSHYEFASSTQGKAIMNCCGTAMIMRQSPSIVDEIIKFFRLSEGTRDILLNATAR